MPAALDALGDEPDGHCAVPVAWVQRTATGARVKPTAPRCRMWRCAPCLERRRWTWARQLLAGAQGEGGTLRRVEVPTPRWAAWKRAAQRRGVGYSAVPVGDVIAAYWCGPDGDLVEEAAQLLEDFDAFVEVREHGGRPLVSQSWSRRAPVSPPCRTSSDRAPVDEVRQPGSGGGWERHHATAPGRVALVARIAAEATGVELKTGQAPCFEVPETGLARLRTTVALAPMGDRVAMARALDAHRSSGWDRLAPGEIEDPTDPEALEAALVAAAVLPGREQPDDATKAGEGAPGRPVRLPREAWARLSPPEIVKANKERVLAAYRAGRARSGKPAAAPLPSAPASSPSPKRRKPAPAPLPARAAS